MLHCHSLVMIASQSGTEHSFKYHSSDICLRLSVTADSWKANIIELLARSSAFLLMTSLAILAIETSMQKDIRRLAAYLLGQDSRSNQIRDCEWLEVL